MIHTELTQKALDYATKKHEGQFRKYSGNPYISHPIRVAEAVYALHGGRPSAENLVAAAFLHDVIEDCNVTREELEKEFNKEIAVIVWELTNEKHSKHLNRAERKRLDMERLRNVSNDAKMIKLEDRLDNLNELPTDKDDFFSKYALESLALLNVIGEANLQTSEKIFNRIRYLISISNTKCMDQFVLDILNGKYAFYKQIANLEEIIAEYEIMGQKEPVNENIFLLEYIADNLSSTEEEIGTGSAIRKAIAELPLYGSIALVNNILHTENVCVLYQMETIKMLHRKLTANSIHSVPEDKKIDFKADIDSVKERLFTIAFASNKLNYDKAMYGSLINSSMLALFIILSEEDTGNEDNQNEIDKFVGIFRALPRWLGQLILREMKDISEAISSIRCSVFAMGKIRHILIKQP